jgi:hypothetical protein
LAITRKEVLTQTPTQASLENMLRERSHTHEVICLYMILSRETSRMGKSMETEHRSVVARG